MALAATAQKPDPKATLSALGGGSFGGLLSGAQSNVAREMQEITPEISRMQRQQKQDRASVASFESKMQPVDLKPWTAQPPAPNPLHAFGSIAGIFAVLASAFTHTPAISAMNGMAAAINARRNNDEEGYKQAYKAWQDNSKLAVERAQLENAEMQTALQKLSTDVQAGVADVKMISAKYGDKTSLMLAEAGLFNQLGMVQAARESAAAKMMGVRVQLETLGYEFGLPPPDAGAGNTGGVPGLAGHVLATQPTKSDPPAIPAPSADFVQKIAPYAASLGETPEALASRLIFQLVTGKADPRYGYGTYGTATQRAWQMAVNQAINVLGPGNVAAAEARYKDAMTQVTQAARVSANVRIFEDTARREANLASSLAGKALAGSGTTVINSWLQAGKKATGNPEVAAFDSAITSFKNEYARIMSSPGASSGMTSDAARSEANELINRDFTPEQFKATVAVMKKSMNNRIAAIDANNERIGKDFRTLFTFSGVEGAATAPEATVPSAPSGANDLPIGSVVTQGGQQYRKTASGWEAVQ